MSKYIDIDQVKRQIIKHWYELEELVNVTDYEAPVLRFMIQFAFNYSTGRPRKMFIRAYKDKDAQGLISTGRYNVIRIPGFLLHPFLTNKKFSPKDIGRVDFYSCMTVDRIALDM